MLVQQYSRSASPRSTRKYRITDIITYGTEQRDHHTLSESPESE